MITQQDNICWRHYDILRGIMGEQQEVLHNTPVTSANVLLVQEQTGISIPDTNATDAVYSSDLPSHAGNIICYYENGQYILRVNFQGDKDNSIYQENGQHYILKHEIYHSPITLKWVHSDSCLMLYGAVETPKEEL